MAALAIHLLVSVSLEVAVTTTGNNSRQTTGQKGTHRTLLASHLRPVVAGRRMVRASRAAWSQGTLLLSCWSGALDPSTSCQPPLVRPCMVCARVDPDGHLSVHTGSALVSTLMNVCLSTQVCNLQEPIAAAIDTQPCVAGGAQGLEHLQPPRGRRA